MTILDDLKIISEIDKSNMIDSVSTLPEQIKESKKIIEEITLNSFFKIDNILISGMGASSITGDIIQSFLRDKLEIPIYVSRQYNLPKWVNKNTLVLTQSYSGNTEETLSTFKHAYQKRSKIIGISSGGKLQEYCKKRNIAHIKIPENYAPRAATGYALFAALFTLKKIGILKINLTPEIEETILITNSLVKKNKKEILEEDNPSKQMAKKIFNKIPQVYGFNFFVPIARRWCNQFNENSKLICRYDEVSECNHNDIVGWSSNPEISKKFICIIFRDSEKESIYMAKRIDFMKKLFEGVSGDTLEIYAQGKKDLSKMMYLMLLGDFISCYLAILRKIDPTPVVAINELKNELSKL